jgi:hypothetical protein
MGIAAESVHSGNCKCAYVGKKFYGLESRAASGSATYQELANGLDRITHSVSVFIGLKPL